MIVLTAQFRLLASRTMKNKFLSFKATQLVAICCGSPRKLMQPPSADAYQEKHGYSVQLQGTKAIHVVGTISSSFTRVAPREGHNPGKACSARWVIITWPVTVATYAFKAIGYSWPWGVLSALYYGKLVMLCYIPLLISVLRIRACNEEI